MRAAAEPVVSPDGHEGRVAGGGGDWRLTAFIAKGGKAEVYCAEHVALGISAAVKVLFEPLTDSRKARFLREAKLLAGLKSPSFPAFHGYGEANGRPYIVVELLEPGELPTGDRQRAKYLLAHCWRTSTVKGRLKLKSVTRLS